MPAGAVKDSIVGEERLVRHLLLELAQQAQQPKGITMYIPQCCALVQGSHAYRCDTISQCDVAG